MSVESNSNAPVRLRFLQYGLHPLTNVPVPGYLIDMADGSRVLVDTGFPPCASGSTRGVHWFRITEEDHVGKRLELLGLRPSSIQSVICSHFDPDHCGGNNLFPQARFFVQREHYQVALSGKHERFEMNRPQWDDPGLNYQLVNGDEEVLPGISLIETSGHVPGHQSVMVRFRSSRKVLLAIDAISNAASADPERYVVHPFDMDPESTRKSIRKLRSVVRSEGVDQVIFGHDPKQWSELLRDPAFCT
jgi:N-acyl homoserine lactone hydrolase